ncbi:uncharacterized protein C8orf89 homolog [Rhinophrynus dorsalis]
MVGQTDMGKWISKNDFGRYALGEAVPSGSAGRVLCEELLRICRCCSIHCKDPVKKNLALGVKAAGHNRQIYISGAPNIWILLFLKKAAYSSNLYQNLCKENARVSHLSEGAPAFSVKHLPPLESCKGFAVCASHLYKDRSKVSNEAYSLVSLQQKQKNFSKYLDPLSGAHTEFLQRISEMAALQSDTIRQEKMRNLKPKGKICYFPSS